MIKVWIKIILSVSILWQLLKLINKIEGNLQYKSSKVAVLYGLFWTCIVVAKFKLRVNF